MPLDLERVASRLRCQQCRAANWFVAGGSRTRPDSFARSVAQRFGIGRHTQGLTCQSCAARYPCERGVLVLGDDSLNPEIAREREAALATERNPALGGINASFDDLANAEGPLAQALLALPWGDGSRHYQEPGYFANVRSCAAGFTFLLQNLGLAAGERLLDLGADLTWSTSHFARRGAECTAVDINHHLSTAHLFERTYGVSYDLVQTDMTTAPFRDAAFDVIVGIDALHHSSDLTALAANLARMLGPGGRLGVVEPYCQTESDKETFGRAQIDAGISEHVYLLEEWHRAFAGAGLVIRSHRIIESFAAVYEKPRETVSPPAESRTALADLFEGFHDAHLTVLLGPPSRVRPGEVFYVPVRVENRSRHTWGTKQFLVRLTYHLYGAGLSRRSAVDAVAANRADLSRRSAVDAVGANRADLSRRSAVDAVGANRADLSRRSAVDAVGANRADSSRRSAVDAVGAKADEADLELVAWDNPRTALPPEVAQGEAVTVPLEVTAPRARGDYVAEIDMLQEYVSWFAEKGTQPRRVSFTVV